ncbi:myosin [Thraustotheca clavata]|uniref:Myosin n=1 Tax=Thraustotheca clavata TaxID=74557 RepID=A0A1V9Y6P6_9STRA|nr:myosin [Thraustotheca clavata]
MPADERNSRDVYRVDHADSLTSSTNGSSFNSSAQYDTPDYNASPGKNDVVRASLANMSVHDLAAAPRNGQRDSLMFRGSEALQHMDPSFHDVRQAPVRQAVIENTDGWSPLLLAARAGDVVEVNALLVQPGTDVLRRDPTFGQSALHFAVRGGHMSVLKALLSPRIVSSIINLPDNRRNTALHLAAAKSRRITKMLLDHGADTQIFNVRNQTPLGVHIITTTKDDPMLCEMLLRYKADPNAKVDQSTLLHVALDKGLVEIALRLVRHGARLDATDENNKTVFEKVDKGLLKRLLSKVNHSPVWIDDKARPSCMLCDKKFSIGTRRHHCRYCGRLCCSECGNGRVAAYKFPQGFKNRIKGRGAAPNHKPQRVCNNCFTVLNEQQKELGREDLQDRQSDLDEFVDRNLNATWNEVKGQANHPVANQKFTG